MKTALIAVFCLFIGFLLTVGVVVFTSLPRIVAFMIGLAVACSILLWFYSKLKGKNKNGTNALGIARSVFSSFLFKLVVVLFALAFLAYSFYGPVTAKITQVITQSEVEKEDIRIKDKALDWLYSLEAGEPIPYDLIAYSTNKEKILPLKNEYLMAYKQPVLYKGSYVKGVERGDIVEIEFGSDQLCRFCRATIGVLSFGDFASDVDDRVLREGINRVEAPASSHIKIAIVYFDEDNELRLKNDLVGDNVRITVNKKAT